MALGQHVVVVDGISETAQVLRAVLEPRGMQVNRVLSYTLTESDAQDHPALVIVHEDESPASAADDVLPPRWSGTPRVVIGSAELLTETGDGRRTYLQKPFQYGELVRAVERLLHDAHAMP